MKINSHNEWDKLNEIIVGNAESKGCLVFPTAGPISEKIMERADALAREAYPKFLIDETNEDLGLLYPVSHTGMGLTPEGVVCASA